MGFVWDPDAKNAADKTLTCVLWKNQSEHEIPYWEVNGSMLERFPVMVDLLELGVQLGWHERGREIGTGYYDTRALNELCRYETYEAWNSPGGENGTRWYPAAWHQNGRIYSFWIPDFHAGCY